VRRAGWAALLLVAPLAAACSGDGGTGAGASASSAAAVRWWTPRAGYCELLRETVRAGRSILLGVGADDPALLDSTRAFVGELERTAPAPVAGSWRVLGPAVVDLVGSRGDLTKVAKLDRTAVQRAATAIAAHAKSSCHVDVSRPAG
jgi:hypothetical protein